MQYPLLLSALAAIASAAPSNYFQQSNNSPSNYAPQTPCVKGSTCNPNQKNNNLNFCCDGTKMLTCGPAGPTAHWQLSSDCSDVGQCFADASWAGCTGSSYGSGTSYDSGSSYEAPYKQAPPPQQQYQAPPPPQEYYQAPTPPQQKYQPAPTPQYKQSSRIRVSNYGGYEQGASCVGREGQYACGEGNNKIYVCGPAGPTAHWQYSDNCGKYGLVCSVSNAFSGCVQSGKTYY
ncbi:hypothetical protein BJ741DRAFT_671538 [Chytriomyces cf. hyalinus JEL632]|nr:hypothetical protein BJ741DRAFT_671538 [Chytriomyces cf. hyalinus JEL632]